MPHEGLNIHAETAATWEAVHPVHSRYILGQYGNRSARSHRLPSPAPAEKHQFREFRLLSVQCQTAALLNLSESQIGRAHVCTPVTNAPLVCRLLLEKKNNI